MSNLIEDSVNLGLGLFAYSRERIEEFVEELVEKGHIKRTDARQFAMDLVKKGEEQKQEIQRIVREEVKQALAEAGLAEKEDILPKEEIPGLIREQMRIVLKECNLTQD